jgi:hypothetical protein
MSEMENRSYQESVIHLNTPEYLVVEPETAYAANYFTSSTRYNDKYFNGFLRSNKFYLFINKIADDIWTVTVPENNGEKKFIKATSSHSFVDKDENEFYENFKEISSFVDELLYTSSTYKDLIAIKNGDILNIDDIIIDNVKISSNNPGKSMVTLHFDTNEFFSLFEFGEFEDSFLQSLFSRYGNWQFRDDYYASEDWTEGYILGSFNAENLDKLYKICNFISPEITRENLAVGNHNLLSGIAKKLEDLFSSEVDYIISEYHDLQEQCCHDSAVAEVQSDMCNVLEKYNIFKKTNACFYKYVTSVNNLISLYKSVGGKSKSLTEVLRSRLSNDGIVFNYEELASGMCLHQFYDDTSFQSYVDSKLDKILDKLENNDEYKNLKEYFDILEKLKQGFGFNRWVELPKDDDRYIRFTGVDIKTNEILYDLKDDNQINSGRGDMEQINLILYHPEIKFDS